jgi:glycosyltransferase involved in cell wall biosynthesis
VSEATRSSLTIGIDARSAAVGKAGRARVVRELIRALAAHEDHHRYRCYARMAWDQPLGERFSWKLMSAPAPLWHVLAALAANRECDVFLSSDSYLTALMLRIGSVVTVYDLFALDPTTRPSLVSAAVERLALDPAIRRADALWCISRATAEALLARCPSVSEKVTVIPLAATPTLDVPNAGATTNLPGPGFVLAVGTLEPRKNLPRLVAAYAALPHELQQAHPLVVVGAQGWRTGETLTALRSLGDRAVLLGHVPDAALGELYRRCAVFCYPSLGEGFGLPVLEAMSEGAPVVTSSTSSLPEVGGEAVEYVLPLSVESIAAALERLLRSPERREELARLGRARASQFSWAATGRGVLDLLEAAAGAQARKRDA